MKMRQSSTCRSLRKSLVSATPILVLVLVVFVVGLNMRHSSMMCDTDNNTEEALHRAAMERRIRALEKEIFHNSFLMKEVLQGLDAAFQASAVLSVEELRLLAQTEASEIGQQRARQPPPPMSEFARSRVSKAVDGGRLQDLVEAAVDFNPGYSSGRGAMMEVLPSEDVPPELKRENKGWDWRPQSFTATDDFLEGNAVAIAEPAKLDVKDEERYRSCRAWLKDYGVTPGVDWGTLPGAQQKAWLQYRCDEVALAADPEPAAKEAARQ